MIQRNAKRHIIVDFVKRMEMAVVTKYLYVQSDITDCKVDVTRECNRHHIVVCCKGLQE